jgi:hypothetical protein
MIIEIDRHVLKELADSVKRLRKIISLMPNTKKPHIREIVMRQEALLSRLVVAIQSVDEVDIKTEVEKK